jgi:hypothetical protein
MLDVPASIGVLANDSDPDVGTTLSAVLIGAPANGTLNFPSDGSFTYVPSAGFSGTVTFTYQSSDGTLTSDVVAVTISVPAQSLTEQVASFHAQVDALDLIFYAERPLLQLLDLVQAALDRRRPQTAVRLLDGFILVVNAFSRQVIPPDVKALLIAEATRIRDAIVP